MILGAPSLSAADRAAADRRWRDWLSGARLRRPRLERLLDQAAEAVARFRESGPFALLLSWGKDSIATAAAVDLAISRGLIEPPPSQWVRFEPLVNPDLPAARDACLERWGWLRDALHETVLLPVWRERAPGEAGDARSGWDFAASALAGEWPAALVACAGTHDRALRRVTGIRGAESRQRRARVARWGEATANTCAPLARWTHDDVYQVCALLDLPLPACYARCLGGAMPRDSIRAAELMGEEGTGMGRAQWERANYLAEVDALSRGEWPESALERCGGRLTRPAECAH